MKIHLRLSFIGVLFLAFVSATTDAQACQCKSEYGVPECASYWKADFVFVARVRSISARPNKHGVYPENTRVRLQILEVLRGGITGEVVDNQSNGADCLVEYEKNKRYVIFAHYYDSTARRINTSTCTGSAEITDADEGYLDVLRGLSERKQESSVLGRVVGYESYKPMSGIEVMLRSNGQTFNTVTDAEGQYKFAVKQEGLLHVSIIIPYEAFDGGYGGIRDTSKGPNQTILEYEESVPIGQCRFKEILVVKLPYP